MVAYLEIPTCHHQDPQPQAQIAELLSTQRDYLWSTLRDKNLSILSVQLLLAEERNHLDPTRLDAPEITHKTDLRQDPSPREDMALIETFRNLDVMTDQVVMAIAMHILRLDASKNRNHLLALAAIDQQTELAIGLPPIDPEMLLLSSLHNLPLEHQLIRITEG